MEKVQGESTMYMKMSLGDKLRVLRRKSKKTMSEKGRTLNVTMNTVHRWEIDSAVPRKTMLNKMADYYGVPVCWLLSETSSASLATEAEQNLLRMYRAMPDNCRHKVIGFVEKMHSEITDNG